MSISSVLKSSGVEVESLRSIRGVAGSRGVGEES